MLAALYNQKINNLSYSAASYYGAGGIKFVAEGLANRYNYTLPIHYHLKTVESFLAINDLKIGVGIQDSQSKQMLMPCILCQLQNEL